MIRAGRKELKSIMMENLFIPSRFIVTFSHMRVRIFPKSTSDRSLEVAVNQPEYSKGKCDRDNRWHLDTRDFHGVSLAGNQLILYQTFEPRRTNLDFVIKKVLLSLERTIS